MTVDLMSVEYLLPLLPVLLMKGRTEMFQLNGLIFITLAVTQGMKIFVY